MIPKTTGGFLNQDLFEFSGGTGAIGRLLAEISEAMESGGALDGVVWVSVGFLSGLLSSMCCLYLIGFLECYQYRHFYLRACH
jgi:hypothetical protein